jgi:NADH-quinone oxidoreductase subunit B
MARAPTTRDRPEIMEDRFRGDTRTRLDRRGLRSERVLRRTAGPGAFEREVAALEGVLGLTTLEKALAWVETHSMWPAHFGLSCCTIEMMAVVGARYDIARFGMEYFRPTPRQSDLMIVPGRLSHKVAAPLRQVYDQMLEPKWVIAMGSCASSGGMFANYAVVQGVDKIVPVDLYVPGCPPRPEALLEGILRLHEKIRAGIPPAYAMRGVAE